MAQARQPRKTRPIPKVLTAKEEFAILKRPNQKCRTGLRNYCMLRLMLHAGLRSAEVLGLKVGDIDWLSGRLHVVEGKGRKDRILWLPSPVLEDLKGWREVRPGSGGAADELLFVTLKGEYIKSQYLNAMVGRLARKASIQRNVGPHLLRHTFATNFYRQTKDLMMVKKVLGHSSVSTTQIYTHLVDDDLEAAMKDFLVVTPSFR